MVALNNWWLGGLRGLSSAWVFAIEVPIVAISFIGIFGGIPECRRIKSRDYLVCGKCGYDLRGGERTICPECGIPIVIETLRAFWKRYIHTNWPTLDIDPRAKPPRWQKRRQLRHVVIAMLAWFLVFVGTSFAWQGSPLSFGIFAALSGFTLQIPLRIAIRLNWRRQCERLLAERGLVCTECSSSVVESGEIAECQQCKAQFVTAQLLQTWERWRPAIWDLEMISPPAKSTAD